MAEPHGQLARALAGFVLLALLVGCLLVAGTTSDELLESESPDQMDVRQDRAAYVGEQVVIGGFVVETDPVVVATLASGHGRFTLVDVDERILDADEPLEVNDRVNAFGYLEDESTLVVERAVTREPADAGYLYGVSMVGGLWIVGRLIRQWRLDPAAIAFVPRGASERASASDDCPSDSDQQHEQTARPAEDDGDHRG
ncbi:hypothetical protein [Natronosalvus rutilus]|uniref:Uncharacterized protein n=1 Tax=Natronosalvus rutilus TaxID=2953753 RepID=A0A9E7NCJ8_9EURY|nr:hypothetical protein [Natronosalvus rutilus]UTF54469.1 hypothetical protein NGM29_04100 [Natronosalvus rutilus]